MAIYQANVAFGFAGWQVRVGDVFAAPIAVDQADATDGSGGDLSLTGLDMPAVDNVQSLSSCFLHGSAAWRPPRFATTNPLLGVVSRDGKKGGTAVGGAAGSLVWVLDIGTPSA